MNGREHTHTRAHTHILYSGMISLAPEQNEKKKKYLEFRRDWYAQASSATMSSDGERSDCSDAVDATGRYIWREDGKEKGRCCGIDFEQAGRKWRADNKCSDHDRVCASAAISRYIPFAYDAGIAMAHGLDKLVRQGVSPDNITADLLTKAIRNSPFEGVTGRVSFLSNGNRQSDAGYVVYNYHATGPKPGFRAVGKMTNGRFAPSCEGGPCAPMIFSDGSTNIPVVDVRSAQS